MVVTTEMQILVFQRGTNGPTQCIGTHCKELPGPERSQGLLGGDNITHSLLVSPFASLWVPVSLTPSRGQLFSLTLVQGTDSMRSLFAITWKETHLLLPVHLGCRGHQSSHQVSVTPDIQVHCQ